MKKNRKLEEIFPIWKIEHDCLLSKQGDITLAYEIQLPELFTLAEKEYDALHHTWLKAIRMLPNQTILHKQDWFLESSFTAPLSDDEKTFLTKSSDRFFHERPYLEHTSYLYFTKRTPKGKKTSPFSALSASNSAVPATSLDAKTTTEFQEKVFQFIKILEDSGFFKAHRLTFKDLESTDDTVGLLEKYFFLLGHESIPLIRDLELTPELRIGELYTQLFTLADINDLPSTCGPRIKFDKYSTDKTSFSVSFAAPLGQLLNCNHIYNQYLVIDDSTQLIKKLESKRLRLQSLSAYSRENTLSRDAVNEFLNEAIGQQRLPVKAHFNILTWTADKGQMKDIRNNVASALAQLDARAKQETVIAPKLFLAGLPGAATELPLHETFDTFAEQASCFFLQETTNRSSISPVGIRLGERLSGRPLHVDVSDLPLKQSVIQARNKFVLAPSGGGKSFFCNHYLRSYYEQNAHCLIVDVGGSYQGLCELVDGYYFTYSLENPIRFNPFFLGDQDLDTEKKESIKALLVALWKKDSESYSRSEYISLSNSLQSYYSFLRENPTVFPCFNTFFDFLRDHFVDELRRDGVKEKHFDVDNFLYVLKPYYAGGEYDYLLNATENLNLLEQRFIVFELDNIKDHPILLSICTLVICETFLSKMRRLKGLRKIMLIEEAWKAIARAGMAEYIKYLFKTVRKFNGEAIVVTQEVDDIIGSPIIKDAIINNSDCKILLDQSKYMNKFQHIQELLGLTEKEKTLILSLNKANDHTKKYKEVFISLGGTISKIYRTEVSLEEYLTYTTEEREKIKVREYATRYGSMQKGISVLAAEIRDGYSIT